MSSETETGGTPRWIRVEWRGGVPVVTGTASWRRNAPDDASHDDPSGVLTAGWHWDGERLFVESDRYGFVPTFVRESDASVTVATSPDALRAAGVTLIPDDVALAVMLRCGFFVGDDTAFAGVQVLPPAARWTWSAGGLEKASARPVPGSAFTGTRADAIHEYERRVARALSPFVERAVSAVVPLSGGRDSRHLLLELHRQGHPRLLALTLEHYPPKANDDAEIAALVCRTLGVAHRVVPQPAGSERVGIEQRKNTLTGFTSLYHGWYVPMAAALPPDVRYVFDGIAGDVLSQSQYLSERRLRTYQEGRLSDLAEMVLGPEGYLPDLLRRDRYAAWSRPRAIARVVEELGRHAAAPNPVGQFYFWNRTRRAIAPSALSLLPRRVQVVTPFVAPEVFDFLVTLPARMLLGRSLHTETIAHAFPQAAALPYEVKGARRKDSGGYLRSYARSLLAACAAHPRGPLWRRGFVVPRATRALVDASFAPAIEQIGRVATYLRQLEAITGRD